jgi:hypothetical protein
MIRIPAFNMLALGLELATHRLIQGSMDSLFKILYMASMSMQALFFLSTVCPLPFTDLLSRPSHSMIIRRFQDRKSLFTGQALHLRPKLQSTSVLSTISPSVRLRRHRQMKTTGFFVAVGWASFTMDSISSPCE